MSQESKTPNVPNVPNLPSAANLPKTPNAKAISTFAARMQSRNEISRLAAKELELIRELETDAEFIAGTQDIVAKHGKLREKLIEVPKFEADRAETLQKSWSLSTNPPGAQVFCSRSGLLVGEVSVRLTDSQNQLLYGTHELSYHQQNWEMFSNVCHPAFFDCSPTNIATLSNVMPAAVATFYIRQFLESLPKAAYAADIAAITGSRLNKIQSAIATLSVGSQLRICDLCRLALAVYGKHHDIANLFETKTFASGWKQEKLAAFGSLSFWAEVQETIIWLIDVHALEAYKTLRDSGRLTNWLKREAIGAAGKAVLTNSGDMSALLSSRHKISRKEAVNQTINDLLTLIAGEDFGKEIRESRKEASYADVWQKISKATPEASGSSGGQTIKEARASGLNALKFFQQNLRKNSETK